MRRTAILSLVIGVLAVACGGAGAERPAPSSDVAVGQETPPAPAAKAPGGSATGSKPAKSKPVDPRAGGFEIGFGEFAIATETKAIRPGKVDFVVRNGGALTHGFEMKSESDGGSHSGPGRGDRFEVEKPLFEPGETLRFSLTLAPGIYELECYVGDHEDLGMRTLLEVRKDAPLVKPSGPAVNDVAIEGFAFGPKTLDVPTGSRVTWTNGDPAEHTVTAEGGLFGSEPLAAGESFAFRFVQPGEYRYFCAIHPSMKGTIRVTA
jgi:uncharacterized cupredoxin-like copper-binding protein